MNNNGAATENNAYQWHRRAGRIASGGRLTNGAMVLGWPPGVANCPFAAICKARLGATLIRGLPSRSDWYERCDTHGLCHAQGEPLCAHFAYCLLRR